MALSRVISEIFSVEKYRDLDIRVKDQSRSLSVVPFDRLCKISYQCSIVNLSLKCAVFEIFDFKNAVTLKTGLGVRQGHWRCHRSIQPIRLSINVLE